PASSSYGLALYSFPTRRSSDLDIKDSIVDTGKLNDKIYGVPASVNSMSMLVNKELADQSGNDLDYENYTFQEFVQNAAAIHDKTDRKSTRLNSSHVSISYAVFC